MIDNFLITFISIGTGVLVWLSINISTYKYLISRSKRRVKKFYIDLENEPEEEVKQLIRGRIYNERVKQYRWQRKLK
jgi:hypothetical protein